MRQLTMERAVLIILFLLLFTIATRIPVDTDTWWHLRSAEYILQNGTIHGDPFSHTFEGEPWINHSWGAQLVLYAVYQLAGNAGLALYTSVLAVGGIGLLYPLCRGNAYLRSFVLVLGASTAAVFWSARPQMISFFFSAVIFYLLYDFKRGGKDRLWFIPLLMLLWGNMHAGYSIGFIFGGAFIAGEILNNLVNKDGYHVVDWGGIRKLVIVGLVSIAALIINPYGLQMLLVPFQTVSIGALRQFIQEWNSPNFQERQTWTFIFMVIGLIGAAWGSRLKFDWTGFLLVSGTLFMSLLAGRQIAVFAVVATPILSHHLDDMLVNHGWALTPRRTVPRRMARLNALLIGVVLLGALTYIVGILLPQPVRDAQEDFLPVRVSEYLNESDLSGAMFNSYNWGGYLMFAVPQHPVFVDGRTDLYGEFLRTYLNTALGNDGWRDTLDEYNIAFVVVEKNSGLDINLREEPGWELSYEDEQAVVHVREDG